MTRRAKLKQLNQDVAFLGSLIKHCRKNVEKLKAAGEMIQAADVNAYALAVRSQASCIRLITKLQREEE